MKKIKLINLLTLLIFIFTITFNSKVYSQGWQREEEAEELPSQELFHSIISLNLPTAETIKKGDFYFNIVHRFNTPIESGPSDLWGLDGSVTMRLELGYGITDDLYASLGRSNKFGNYELAVKYKTFEIKNEVLPINISLIGGMAYNDKPQIPTAQNSDKYQFFGQVPINMLYDKKLGFGIVPSYLYNSNINCDCIGSATIGSYVQYYIDDMWSVLAETNNTIDGYRGIYDSYSIGVEMETGGHFFKFLVSNNININMSQFLAGSAKAFDKSNGLHLGFQITRNL